jgi:hypothetical protein
MPSRPKKIFVWLPMPDDAPAQNVGQLVSHGFGRQPLQAPSLDGLCQRLTASIAKNEPIQHHIGVKNGAWC